VFFPLRSLVGALVVDSKGFRYGYLEEFDGETMELVVRTYREVSREGVDLEKLLENIRRHLSRRRLFGRIDVEAVVSEELGLSGRPRLADYLEYARLKGIEVPRELIREKVSDIKGRVSALEVENVGVTVFLDESGRERIVRIILLKTPREAEYRGAVGSLNLANIIGKRVIDVYGRYLGVVDDLVLGRGLGIAVRMAKIKYARTSAEDAPQIPQLPRVGVSMTEVRGVGDYVLIDVKYVKSVEELW